VGVFCIQNFITIRAHLWEYTDYRLFGRDGENRDKEEYFIHQKHFGIDCLKPCKHSILIKM
jgi:hypothetical protein